MLVYRVASGHNEGRQVAAISNAMFVDVPVPKCFPRQYRNKQAAGLPIYNNGFAKPIATLSAHVDCIPDRWIQPNTATWHGLTSFPGFELHDDWIDMTGLPPVRRIVTGHDAGGKAIVAFDTNPPITTNPSGTSLFTLVWTSEGVPADQRRSHRCRCARSGAYNARGIVAPGARHAARRRRSAASYQQPRLRHRHRRHD